MQPYTNPYYFQNSPTFQQQQMYSPVSSYQDRLAQLQAQYNPQQVYGNNSMQNQQMYLNGEVVDSIDVVNAKNVDLSGNITYYPKSDLSEIYTKQLQPDGRSKTLVYKLVNENENIPEQKPVTIETLTDVLGKMKTDMISEIKAILPEQNFQRNSRSSKGANQE